MIESYTSLHCHSEYSSAVLRFADSIGKVKDLVNYGIELGLNGVALTDHQTVAGFVDLEQTINSLNFSRPFQHIFGNEVYLISEEEDNQRFEENFDGKIKYWHFLVNVLDPIGLKQLYQLSALAWKRSYTYRGILRRPNFYSDFENIVGKNPGHLIVSSACIGGFLPQAILQDDKKEALNFVKWNQQVFGKNNFFLECQPCLSTNEEQIKVNKELWNLHKKYDIPIIVTTDVHFLKKEDRIIHTAFLKSKDGGDSREPEKFYETTYMFSPQELREKMYNSSFNDEQIDCLFETTNQIAKRIEPIVLKKKTRVPGLPKIPKFEIKHEYKQYYDKYKYINYYANSDKENERYFYSQIEKGLINYSSTHNIDIKKYLKQLNIEFEQIKGLGEIFGECMSDYFSVIQKVVNLIWTRGDSFVGIGRGSAGCWITNFLLGITGIDPLLSDIHEFYPWWRFCSIARSDSIMDIDLDIQSFKKEKIIEAIKEYFGEDRVLQCVTWGRLSSKTALERAGKGLGISSDEINYLKSLIPIVRGKIYSLSDCLYGNKQKEREKVSEFINEINKYPDLLKVALALEGMIVSSGVHAGAVLIDKEAFYETGSLMVSSNGAVTSQFDLHQSEYAGDLKFDLLSIDALEIIRACLDLLLENNKIEWQGSLRKTYNKYLGYDALEKDNKEMWSLLPKVPLLFQYDSRAGQEALRKIGAKNLVELTLANGLMRLILPGGEQPMDKYVRYRDNIQEWYQDMTDYKIPQEEQEILKDLLKSYSGLMISQATMMSVLMDDRVCGFTLKEADKARKAVAKRNEEALKETEHNLYTKGKEHGRSQAFLDYLWKVQIEMSKSYAFDFSHSHEYSTEALQELNLYWKYPEIYWDTAVIIAQAQTGDERKNVANTVNYTKIAQSIYKARLSNIIVKAPSINQSGLTFTPNEETNSILFGLAGIAGINTEIAQQIIDNRPYTSFEDFCSKNSFEKSLVTQSKFIQLIKAGCFDEFNSDRLEVMNEYISLSTPDKKSITLANVSELLRIGVTIPKKLINPYKFRKYVCRPQFFYNNHPQFKSKKIYWLDEKAKKYFDRHCISMLKEETDYFYEDDKLLVVDKSLEKIFKENTEQLKEYLNQPEVIKEYNQKVKENKLAALVPNLDTNHWMFEACSFYDRQHELAEINQDYDIVNFDELPESPIFITKKYGNKEWKQMELSRIAGTVLGRVDSHHILTILDKNNNVISCKFTLTDFAEYKRQISTEEGVVDPSWFKRGQTLILTGVRMGQSDFRVKNYRSSIYQYKVQRIDSIDNEGYITTTSTRWDEE